MKTILLKLFLFFLLVYFFCFTAPYVNAETLIVNESGGEIRLVSTVATLRQLGGRGDETLFLEAHSIPGDGGSGYFRWEAGRAPGTYGDNNGTTVVPTGGDGSAAWLRIYAGEVNVRWFGARGDGVTDDTRALQAALALGGSTIVPDGLYLCKAAIGIDEKAVNIRGSGRDTAAFLFTDPKSSGLSIRQSTNTPTKLSDLSILTTAAGSGTAVSVAYNQKVLQTGRNNQLVSFERVKVAGQDPFANGWKIGIAVIDVNTPIFDDVWVVGWQDRTAPKESPRYHFANMEAGVLITATGNVELNYPRFNRCRMKNMLTAIKVLGMGEGLVVNDCALTAVETGIHVDRTGLATKESDPQVMIFSNHINSARRGVYLKRVIEAQIANNLFYSYPHIDIKRDYAAIEADICRLSQFNNNLFVGFKDKRNDLLRGILGGYLSDSQINGNHYINVDVPVEFTSANASGNVIANEMRSPESDTTPMVVHSGTALAHKNYFGPVASFTHGLKVAEPATVAAVSQDVAGGKIYRVTAAVKGKKGAAAGNVHFGIARTAGTAAVTFLTYAEQSTQVAAAADHSAGFTTFVTPTTSGTLTLALRASSTASDFTIEANQASISIELVP